MFLPSGSAESCKTRRDHTSLPSVDCCGKVHINNSVELDKLFRGELQQQELTLSALSPCKHIPAIRQGVDAAAAAAYIGDLHPHV
jgi:hypothetical protein